MNLYPIGIQDFEEVRKGGFVYVDKTRHTFDLIRGGKHYFLSRPRRFGKSLLLSTLKYFFKGRRDLFTGLWVDTEADWDWQPHPVLHFSFSSSGYKDIGLEKALLRLLREGAEQYGLTLTEEGLSGRFKELIQKLGSGERKVVLLIDEYDKPLIDYLDDLPQANANRETLKNFFSVLKDCDGYIRFFLITGVSKFSKVSIFSDLNNLEDLTINRFSATLTGYTQAELESCFAQELTQIAEEHNTSRQDLIQRVRTWYNGYRWTGSETLYNPFSILNFMKLRTFANYWWQSGTPTFLLKALHREFQFDLREVEVGNSAFESYSLENLDWRGLLFQTGYLTIKKYTPEYDLYTLGYPNREVEDAMSQHLLATFREGAAAETQAFFAHIKMALDAGDMEKLVTQVNALFASIPHQIFDAKREGFFHAVLHLTFQGIGLLTRSEVNTSLGRVDTVVWAKKAIYVMEFKLDGSAAEALGQIRGKRYGDVWLGSGMPVMAVGICFSSETRTVAELEIKPYAELIAEN
jgi:hypothetical protein